MFQMLGEQNEKYSRRFDCWRSNYHCDLDVDLFQPWALGPFTQRGQTLAARLGAVLFWASIVLFWASVVLAVLWFYLTYWL
jgi:hypothetical protein